MKKPLVVLRSNDNCFLDIIRACGSHGIEVIAVVFYWNGATDWNSEKSCYFKNVVQITNPVQDEEKAKTEMIAFGKKLYRKYGEKLLIIPSSDTNLYFLQKNFADFYPYFLQMGHGNFDQNCMREYRKDNSMQLLEKAGIDIPLTFSVSVYKDIEPAVRHMIYPCIYKPVIKDLSSSFQNTHLKNKAIECSCEQNLRENLLKELRAGYELIVQEKITFTSVQEEVSCYVYAGKDGRVCAISGQHKIMEWPHPYGTGVISKPYIEREFLKIAQKICHVYQWRGFLGIEFMKNKKNGKWVVIEINIRPWISINFQATIGFNYLAMMYDDYYGLASNKGIKVMDESFFNIYRVNLTMFVKREMSVCKNKRQAFEHVLIFLKERQGNIIFSYYTMDDEGPGIAEKIKMEEEYPEYTEEIGKLYEAVKQNNFALCHK